MAIASSTGTNDNTSFVSFYNWAHFAYSSFVSFGWQQTADAGQIVWPTTLGILKSAVGGGTTVVVTYDSTVRIGPALAVGMSVSLRGFTVNTVWNATWVITAVGGSGASSTFSFTQSTSASETPTANTTWYVVNTALVITSAVGTGKLATYSYDDTVRTGSALMVGQQISVTGCTSSGFNITGYVTALTGQGTSAATFTIACGLTQTTEAETAAGLVLASVSAGAVNFTYFAVFKAQDTLSSTAPYYVKLFIGNGGNTASWAVSSLTVGLATDGFGNFLGPALTNARTGQTSNSAGSSANYASGDAGSRYGFQAFRANAACYAFALERSIDVNGNYTGEYVTLIMLGLSSNALFGTQQTLYLSTGAITTLETGGVACILPRTATTGTFGANTLASPVFPLVGSLGFPMTTLLMGCNADFADQVTITVTLYGVAHNYLAFNPGTGTGTAVVNGSFMNTTTKTTPLMRYE